MASPINYSGVAHRRKAAKALRDFTIKNAKRSLGVAYAVPQVRDIIDALLCVASVAVVLMVLFSKGSN